MTFLSPYVLPVAQLFEVLKFIQFSCYLKINFLTPHPILSAKNRSMIAFTDLFLFIFAGYLFFDFSITLSATSFELADKVIENQKKKYIEWHFCHHMYFLSLSCLRCWNSFNSSCYLKINFLTPHPILSAKNRSMIAFTDLFLFIFAGYLFFDFSPYQQLPLSWLIR